MDCKITLKNIVNLFLTVVIPSVIVSLLLYYFQEPLFRMMESHYKYSGPMATIIILLYSAWVAKGFGLNFKGKLLLFVFCSILSFLFPLIGCYLMVDCTI